MPATTAEQISAFEAKRAANAAAMKAIMAKSAEDGSTLDADQQTEFDGLQKDNEAIDSHLKRLRVLETEIVIEATAVNGKNKDDGSASRGGQVRAAVMKKELPPGIRFARMARAVAISRGSRSDAADFAKQWKDLTPEIEAILRIPTDVIARTAVDIGTTSDTDWAAPLVQYQNLASEFVNYLRPMTILGRIQGFRRVPFKVKVPRQTSGASVNWVGEAKVKPLSQLAFDSLTMDLFKVAGIIPLSEELIRTSTPSAELLIRDDLAGAIAQFSDSDFIDPTKAATDVSPASITYGVSAITATGTTAAALRADIKSMFSGMLTAGLQIASGVWIMRQGQALAISLMQNALGQPEFPGITVVGGTFLGFPVVATQNIPSSTGSPADGYPIIFAIPGEIMLAEDDSVQIDISREASLQMETTPDSPATGSTTLVSLWQHNLVAIKAERFMNWKARRSGAVGLITGAVYAE